jgi:hypothetical protein
MADSAEYLQRLYLLTNGKDPLLVQADTAPTISALIHLVPDADLKRRPAPGKWSVVEVVAHLAEDELVTSWRYRQMLEHPGCSLAGFDQDKWADWGRYGEWSSQEALDRFTLLRTANLRMLRALNPEEWMRFGEHAERGRITVRDLALHMAGHDLNHLEQIRALLADPNLPRN